MENAVNTNGQREKFPAESQHFFKHEKEERRSFLILINTTLDDDRTRPVVSGRHGLTYQNTRTKHLFFFI